MEGQQPGLGPSASYQTAGSDSRPARAPGRQVMGLYGISLARRPFRSIISWIVALWLRSPEPGAVESVRYPPGEPGTWDGKRKHSHTAGGLFAGEQRGDHGRKEL